MDDDTAAILCGLSCRACAGVGDLLLCRHAEAEGIDGLGTAAGERADSAAQLDIRRVGKANGSRERAPGDRLRVPTFQSTPVKVCTARTRLCPPYDWREDHMTSDTTLMRSSPTSRSR